MAPIEDDSNLTPTERWKKMVKTKILNSLNFGLIFNIAMHVAMVVIAAINLQKCPVGPLIPRILLAEGVVGTVAKLLGIFRERIRHHIKVDYIFSLLSVAELVLFIMGAYYTFKAYRPSYDPSSGDHMYCNKTVYLFSLVYVSINLALLGLVIFGVCCFVTCLCTYDKCCHEKGETSSQMGARVAV